jgi:hypothetical protein
MTDGKMAVGLIALAVATIAFFGMSLSRSNLTQEPNRCISRTTIIQRAQDWVNKHVPYD